MVTLVKETGAGLTNSNSYANLSDGNTYHEMRLHVDDWTNASDSDREKALMWGRWSTPLLILGWFWMMTCLANHHNS